MPPFRFHTVLRQRLTVRDDARQRFAEIQTAEQRVADQIASLESRLAELRNDVSNGSGSVDIAQMCEANRYAEAMKAKRAKAHEHKLRLVEEVDAKRQALIEADREVKSLEKLRDNHEARESSEVRRQEGKLLDEVAMRGASRLNH
jgi:flagellar export protein FliJ